MLRTIVTAVDRIRTQQAVKVILNWDGSENKGF